MKFLKSIRFVSDKASIDDTPLSENDYMQDFLHSCVLVTEDTFPRLSKIIIQAFENIKQDCKSYPFFVQPSVDTQAACVRSSANSKPLFLLTSSIIEKMNDDELKFIIGHEFAHYFFKHKSTPESNDPISRIRNMILSRASEISADRMGLVACKNLNAATSVLIKLSTGLDEKNVKFNISAFLKQYKHLMKYGPNRYEAMSSHPLFLIRLRALILFSRTKQYLEQSNRDILNQINISEVDEILRKDFIKLSGLSLDNIDNTLISKAMLYGVFLVFVNDGKLSKDEQAFLKEYFGDIDISEIIEIFKEKGIDGLAYEFESLLNYIYTSNLEKHHLDNLNNFFEIVLDTFKPKDTKRVKEILNGML